MKLRIDYSKNGAYSMHPQLRLHVRSAVSRTLKAEAVDVPCLVNVMFTDNKGIKKINAEYRQVERETDVLSFPANEFEPGKFDADTCEYDYSSGRYLLGDIVISVPKCEEQAREFGHSFYREIEYLTVHSMLHLLGYDHVDEAEMKKQMRDREKIIMGETK